MNIFNRAATLDPEPIYPEMARPVDIPDHYWAQASADPDVVNADPSDLAPSALAAMLWPVAEAHIVAMTLGGVRPADRAPGPPQSEHEHAQFLDIVRDQARVERGELVSGLGRRIDSQSPWARHQNTLLDLREDTDALLRSITSDRHRCAAVYAFSVTVAIAYRLMEEAAQAKRQELQNNALYPACPLCGRRQFEGVGDDRKQTATGAVMPRDLRTGQPAAVWPVPGAVSLDSCLACFHEAAYQAREALASETTTHGQTRRDAVRTQLASLGVTGNRH